jgi:hypothetical protein
MKYELKKVYKTGPTKENRDKDHKVLNTLTQYVNITIAVKNCGYADIKSEKTVPYVFDKNLTHQQIEDGIKPFAEKWVAENYPETEGSAE